MTIHFKPAALTPANVARLLRSRGYPISATNIALERRGDRSLVKMPGGRLAWFAATAEAADHLLIEDRLLSLISDRCSFRVPEVLSSSEGWSVRSMVAGVVDPGGFAERLRSDPALISRIAWTMACLLADQHTHVGEAEVAGWLPTAPAWPLPRTVVEARLPAVSVEPELRRRIDLLLDAYDEYGAGYQDRVLVHGDFGFHNMAIEPSTGEIFGIFDYGSAAWADRHLDFRYLTFGAVQDSLLAETIFAYQNATGVVLDRGRVLLCNAAAAVSHLADRAGFGDDEIIGGRTLAGDLHWTQWALQRIGL